MQAFSQLYERSWVYKDKIIGEVQREVCCFTRRLGNLDEEKNEHMHEKNHTHNNFNNLHFEILCKIVLSHACKCTYCGFCDSILIQM